MRKRILEEKINGLANLLKQQPQGILFNEFVQFIREYLSLKSDVEDSEVRDVILSSLHYYNSMIKGSFCIYLNSVFSNHLINSHPILKLPEDKRLLDPRYHQLQQLLIEHINKKGYYYNGRYYAECLYPCIFDALRNYKIERGPFIPYFDAICRNEFTKVKYQDTNLVYIPQEVCRIMSSLQKHFGREKDIFEKLKRVVSIIKDGDVRHLASENIKLHILRANSDFSLEDADFMVTICEKHSINQVQEALNKGFLEFKSLEFLENSHTTTKKEATNDIDSLPTVDPEFLKSMNTVYNNFTSTVSERQVISLWCSFHLGKYVKFHNDNPLILSTLANCSYYNTSVLQEIEHKDQSITQKYIAQKLHVSETLVSNSIAKFRKALIDELKIQHLQENKENITNQKKKPKNNFRKNSKDN